MTFPSLPFVKMHGCGNDYVVVDASHAGVGDPSALARRVNDRRFGIGADGLLLAQAGETHPLRMRMFNVDGSEAEMCGNGLRCLVKFAYERDLIPRTRTGRVETCAGILAWEVHADANGRIAEVTIDMGQPRLDRAAIPMSGPEGRVIDESLEVGERSLEITAVSMGNPHAVAWVDDVTSWPLEVVGPEVEHHTAFPARVNAEFVEVVSSTEVKQRTWERGCGETLACGTGACAVVVAGVLTGRTEREVLVHLRGGDLKVRWDERDHVLKRGPAVEVFAGVWPGVEE